MKDYHLSYQPCASCAQPLWVQTLLHCTHTTGESSGSISCMWFSKWVFIDLIKIQGRS